MNHSEGQPRLRLIQPLKRMGEWVTRKGKKENTPPWLVDNPWLLHNPRLTQRDQEILKTYNPFTDPLYIQDREMRAKDPKIPTQIEINGKMVTMYEGWIAYLALWERLEREAAARGDTEIDYSQLPWRPQPQRYQDLTPEARREKNLTTVRKIDNRLTKEAREAHFDQMAESIQERVWKTKPSRTLSLAIKPSNDLKVRIINDGTVVNRSRFGATISFTHKDGETHIPQEGELSFGIGYFTDRTQIIPEAQQILSDDQLQTGVKAYYVERTYTFREKGKAERKTYLSAIPIGYQETQETFFEYLYTSAKLLAPEKQQGRSHRRNRPNAAAA